MYLQNEVKKILEGTASFVQSKAKISVQNDPRLYLSNGEKVAFISYRSYYNEPNKCGGYSVQDLKRYIIDYHKAQNPNEKGRSSIILLVACRRTALRNTLGGLCLLMWRMCLNM